MKKCEVIADRITLTVCKGSVVNVDDVQAEIARQFLKPLDRVQKQEVEEEVKTEKKSKKK